MARKKMYFFVKLHRARAKKYQNGDVQFTMLTKYVMMMKKSSVYICTHSTSELQAQANKFTLSDVLIAGCLRLRASWLMKKICKTQISHCNSFFAAVFIELYDGGIFILKMSLFY
jgi:hypothetical protein